MVKRENLNDIDKQVGAVLSQMVTFGSCRFVSSGYTPDVSVAAIVNLLSEKVYVRGDALLAKAKNVAEITSSYANLVKAITKLNCDFDYSIYKLFHMMFSHHMLQQLISEETYTLVLKLDECLEGFTQEDYTYDDEGESKRNMHMLLFTLNAYVKIMLSEYLQDDKDEMYELLGNSDKYRVIEIVASIYYNNPRVCSNLLDMRAVAGSLIAKKREHYASTFLIAERYARHERKCVFEWQNLKHHYYNEMVTWSKEKAQKVDLVRILSVIFPQVKDWNPENNSFHLMRGKRKPEDKISQKVKNYVDAKNQESKDYTDKRLEQAETQNQRAHMYLSERIGEMSGKTEVHVENGGVYNEKVNRQNLIGSDVDEVTVRKLIE